ncbi:hypothetical protein KCP77_20770 [Salmonella enterica subsp. enterica]|nr:hypothetical protein KCP77_20770 [Salmonella enterica subsp. enterica]
MLISYPERALAASNPELATMLGYRSMQRWSIFALEKRRHHDKLCGVAASRFIPR